MISSDLGQNRREINSLLHARPDTFQKNGLHEWGLVNKGEVDSVPTSVHLELDEDTEVSATLVIDNLDLNDRLQKALSEQPGQKVRSLAASLAVSRQLVTKTLNSFEDIFVRNGEKKWFVRTIEEDEVNKSPINQKETRVGEAAANYAVEPRFLANAFEEKYESPQQAVIEAKLNRNILVLAPPGTGKTHTLIERLVFALDHSQNNIDAGEFLILSFTRAAVAEVRERIAKAILAGAPSALRYVQVKTFDSYATWLLNDGGYEVERRSYDQRIILLTEELANLRLRQTTRRVDRSRYLFVDEIQDLVGVRADMVFELIKRILARNGSVTLLGDPDQSLYEYQSKESSMSSSKFLEKVRSLLSGGLDQVDLIDSHRYETAEMKEIAERSKAMLDRDDLSAEDKFNALLDLLPESSWGDLQRNFENDKVDALLCRTNIEVYQWLNWNEQQGYQSNVNLGSVQRPWPSWIAEAVVHYQAEVITSSNLLMRMNAGANSTPDDIVKKLDRFLVNEKLLRANVINLDDLAFRLKHLSPAGKESSVEVGVTVSTVHKAKGLEYGHVLIVEPVQRNVTEEEVRVLYVAITRAKRSVALLRQSEVPFSVNVRKGKGGRFRYTKDNDKYLQVLGLEDFDLDTLFFDLDGSVDTDSLENYFLCYGEEQHYLILPESCNDENDHNYFLYLDSTLGLVRLCEVSAGMKSSLDAMSYGNKFKMDGAMLDLGNCNQYQSIVHPQTSPLLSRKIGQAGILPFPFIEGFYPLSKASGVND